VIKPSCFLTAASAASLSLFFSGSSYGGDPAAATQTVTPEPIAPPAHLYCDTLASGDYQLQFGPVVSHPGYAGDMIDWQEQVTEKPYRILRYSQEGILQPNTLTLSGTAWGTWLYEESNTPGKFPILSRFPDQHGSTATSADKFLLNNAAVATTARIGEWITLFAQGEYSDIEFVGQEQYQLRKAFVMVGNLDAFPFYAYFGRNTVDFGGLDAYNPFTHSVNNHSFRVDSDDPVIALGFAPKFLPGFNLVATAIPGGRHLRVADSDGGGQFDNYAVNASYLMCITDELTFEIGGGWLNSTIYDTEFANHPGASFDFSEANSVENIENGAWDVNAELKWRGLSIGGELTSTEAAWPTTDHKVRAINGQVAYDFPLCGLPSRLSFVYGVTDLGPDDVEYEELTQIAVGLETQITRNFSLGIEYVRNSAFVPLIAITQASDADVRTDTILIGGKFTF